MWICSGITVRSMLRQKKFVQESVHLKEALAIQRNRIAIDSHEPPILQSLHGLRKLRRGIQVEFFRKIGAADVAEFELQNEFANEPFFRAGCQRAANGKCALANPGQIRLEVMFILVMHPAEVAE